jgi:hypothetical protein
VSGEERIVVASLSVLSTTLACVLLWLAIGVMAGALRGWLREAGEPLPQPSIAGSR